MESPSLQPNLPTWLWFLAKSVSYVLHPLFLLSYGFLLLAWLDPFLFGEISFSRMFSNPMWVLIFFRLLIFTALVPAFAIILMRALGLVSSIELPQRQERTGPYLIAGVFYMVTFVQYNNDPGIPMELRSYALGATLALFIGFVINIFSKISLHTLGMGGFIAMVILALARDSAHDYHLLALAIFLAGLVGTARLLLQAHEENEIYGGYFIGFFAQFAALSWVYMP